MTSLPAGNGSRRLSGWTSLVLLSFFAAILAACSSTVPSEPSPAGAGVGTVEELRARALADSLNPEWSFRIAEIEIARGETLLAEQALREALARKPEHVPSAALLSRIFFEAGRHQEGVELLEASRRSGDLAQELAIALALHYDALGKTEAAEEIARTTEASLEDWDRNGSAIVYLRLRGEHFAESLAVARRALEARPSAVNYNNYGIAQLYAGDPEGGRASFLRAHELDGELPGPLYNLAIVDWFYFFAADAARDWFARYQKLAKGDPDGLAEVFRVHLARSEAKED
jgi:tetratricopeptide (TPR) repeat protein